MHCESILKTFSRYLDAKSERIRSYDNSLCQQNQGATSASITGKSNVRYTLQSDENAT